MLFTFEELNMIREWFNVVEDVSPEYLEQRDKDLGRRITEFLRHRGELAAGQPTGEPHADR